MSKAYDFSESPVIAMSCLRTLVRSEMVFSRKSIVLLLREPSLIRFIINSVSASSVFMV